MTTRETSIECYRQIKEENLLPKARMGVFEALYRLGKPSTAREVNATMSLSKMEATRFTELRDMGVIYEHGVRKCTVTGRKAIEWGITGNLPQKIVKKTKKPNLKKTISFIIKKMDEDGLIFIDEKWLKNLL